MSEHKIALRWTRTSNDFLYPTYNRAHTARFKNGAELGMSASPDYKGDKDKADPEELLVAALSSCHMLSFLAIAQKAGFVVDNYADDAVGILTKNAEGKLAITEVTLRPKVQFAVGKGPTDQQLHDLHHKSHEVCFIANSVKTLVKVE